MADDAVIQELKNQVADLSNKVGDLLASLKSHQHLGPDSSSKTEGKTELKASVLYLSGGASAANAQEEVVSIPLVVFDNDSSIGSSSSKSSLATASRRAIGMAVGVSGRGTSGEAFRRTRGSRLQVQRRKFHSGSGVVRPAGGRTPVRHLGSRAWLGVATELWSLKLKVRTIMTSSCSMGGLRCSGRGSTRLRFLQLIGRN